MTDYRTFFDKEYVYAYDLDGKEATVTIVKVEGRELASAGGKKNKKPVVFFKGKEKGLAINATNGKTIASMYGKNVEGWVGKRITIFPTTTSMAGDTVECIRVKPVIPPVEKEAGK